MKKTIKIFAVITSIAFLLLAGCSGGGKTAKLELDRLQSNTGTFQFYDLAWESDPSTVQESLGITFGEPDTAGVFQIYRSESAYTWNNVIASLTCEYESDKLYTVTLLFMPEEAEREGFWSALKEELFHLYGTVEANTQTSTSDQLNISTESESYLWQDQDNGNTLISITNLSVNGKFKYIALRIYVLSEGGEKTADSPAETENLFQYALEIEDGVFAPRQVEFFTSMEEILRENGLYEDAVIDREGTKTVRTDTRINGFPYDAYAMYDFDKNIGDLLYQVRYFILVDEADAADIYHLLYEQAVSTMPEASGNSIEGIKGGVGASWKDTKRNHVGLSIDTFSARDEGSVIISLDIGVTPLAEPFMQAYGNVMEAEIAEVVSYDGLSELYDRGTLKLSGENSDSMIYINIQPDTIIQDADGKRLDFTELKEGQSIRAVTHPRASYSDPQTEAGGNTISEGEEHFWLCYEIIIL